MSTAVGTVCGNVSTGLFCLLIGCFFPPPYFPSSMSLFCLSFFSFSHSSRLACDKHPSPCLVSRHEKYTITFFSRVLPTPLTESSLEPRDLSENTQQHSCIYRTKCRKCSYVKRKRGTLWFLGGGGGKPNWHPCDRTDDKPICDMVQGSRIRGLGARRR